MDFGDILSQWDSIQKNHVPKNKGPQICRKKANAPTKEEKEAARQGYSYEQIMDQNSQKRINPMELWLRRYGTVDKDKAFEENARQEKLNDINYLKTLAPEATIDLHQLTREEAWDKLKILLTAATSGNSRKFLSSTEKEITAMEQIQFLGNLCGFLLSRTSVLELPAIQTEITAALEQLG